MMPKTYRDRTPKVSLREELAKARSAINEMQYWLASGAREMEQARTVLRCCSELYRGAGYEAHADLASGAAGRLAFDIDRYRKVAELSVDAAIADLTIPF